MPSPTSQSIKLTYATPLLVCAFPGQHAIIDNRVTIPATEGVYHYALKGLIYYNHNHFTSCIITDNNMCWYHDGMTTGPNMACEGHINTIPNLLFHTDMQANTAIYALQ